MLEDLRLRGVNTESVRTVEGMNTGTAYITVTPDGENTIVLDPGANAFVDAAAAGLRAGADAVQRPGAR